MTAIHHHRYIHKLSQIPLLLRKNCDNHQVVTITYTNGSGNRQKSTTKIMTLWRWKENES